MSKADYKIEGTVPRELLVSEVRKAARQFAMQFFHFSKVLYDQFGLEKTKDIVRQTVFELAVDRSDQLSEKALAQGLKADSVEAFMSVIILEGTCCKREYFESDKVKRGEYTYGKKEEN